MKILSYIRSHAVLSTGIAIIAVVVMIIAGRVSSRGNAADSNETNIKKVSLIDVSNFSDNTSKISADGVVESVSQVDLRSQISAPLATVNVSVGDYVSAGQTIAIMQNADVRALLDQARAGLQLARGQYQGSGISLESAERSALETVRGSYLNADEVVNIEIAQFLYNNIGGDPKLSTYISDRQLGDEIRNSYLESRRSFRDWKETLNSLSESSSNQEILAAINYSRINLQDIASLLDNLSFAISEAIENHPHADLYGSFTEWQSTVLSARNSINTSLKNLTSAEAALSGAKTTFDSPAEAQISSAEASVKNLEAQLAKTIITSPISGRIAEVPLRAGELAQPGQLIATVVGGGGLRVRAYASGEDLSRIKTGAKAVIQDNISGTVTSVAPSVNQTNRRVEIEISINNAATSNLVIGQNVNVSIDAANIPIAKNKGNYLLPIQNVKIVPGAAYVFTVDSESKIVKNPVIIEKVEGDYVEIASGITPDMKIVSPVYELEEGEQVTWN